MTLAGPHSSQIARGAASDMRNLIKYFGLPLRRVMGVLAVVLLFYFESFSTVVIDSRLELAGPVPAHRCHIDASTSPGRPGFRFDIVVPWVNVTARAGCHGNLRYLLRSLKSHGMWPDLVGTVCKQLCRQWR